jgi:hypothetical protein
MFTPCARLSPLALPGLPEPSALFSLHQDQKHPSAQEVIRMRELLDAFSYAMLALVATAAVLGLLGITLKALSWVVRLASRIGRGS